MSELWPHLCVLVTNRTLARLAADIHNAKCKEMKITNPVDVVAALGSWAVRSRHMDTYAMVNWKTLQIVGWESPNRGLLKGLSGPWMGDGA